MIDDEAGREPSQALRSELVSAIDANDLAATRFLLKKDPRLVNSDLRTADERNAFPYGQPLYLACQRNAEALANVLLAHGADPDAPAPSLGDRPAHGLPLHSAVAEHGNLRLAHSLLDYGATPNSYPYCDKATIECVFYQAREAGMTDRIVRRAFARYLPDPNHLEVQSVAAMVEADAADAIKLFARMVDLGAQTPFTALVRERFDELLLEIVDHSHSEPGTMHDYPSGNVLSNIWGAARWHGFPQLVRRLMDHSVYQYRYDDAISTITTAISSHNRDGSYQDYREIILMQLEELKVHDDLERARQDVACKPLYRIATDFTWHDNYGYRASIATPECYIDLAELFVSWGFTDVEHRDPDTNHSPLTAAVTRGHHPGITTYIRWLLERGVDLRESDAEELNPIAIARKKHLDTTLALLQRYAS